MGATEEETALEKRTEDFQPAEYRKCTDCLFALLIIAVWFAMTVVGFIATGVIENDSLPKGDPNRLLNGVDYAGRTCGVSDGVTDLDKAYLMTGLQYTSALGYYVDTTGDHNKYIGKIVCVAECPGDAWPTGETAQCVTDNYVGTGISEHDEIAVYTTDVLNYCVPANNPDATDDDASTPEGCTYDGYDTGFLQELWADIYTALPVIGGFGFGGAIVLGFLYLLFLRIPGVLMLMIWGMIFMVLGLLAGGGLMLTNAATSEEDKDPMEKPQSEVDAMRYTGFLLLGLAALWVLLICYLRKRIQLAISVVKEASRAIASMPILIVFPLIQSIGVLLFMIPWIVYALYLASSGDKVEDDNGIVTYQYTSSTEQAIVFHLFAFFWTSQFIVAVGQLVVALAVVFWYFNRDKSTIGNGTVIKAIKITFTKHLGTAAHGSLVIAIIKTIRAVLTYIQRKAKKSGNKALQFVLCLVQCCLKCLEKCMKFINKNAYIQTALFGSSFCTAARKAFFLILRNAARMAAVSMVSDFVLTLGKVFITVTAGVIGYLYMDSMSDDLNGIVLPLIFTVLVAYFVANMFTEVFGMAISTVLQAFIADEEMFEPDKRYAEKGLKKFVDSGGKAGATKASAVEPV